MKKAAGKAVGNESLQAEGKGQKTKGEARKDVAKGVEAVKGTAKEIAGKVQKKAAGAVGNTSKKVQGAAKEMKGKIQK